MRGDLKNKINPGNTGADFFGDNYNFAIKSESLPMIALGKIL